MANKFLQAEIRMRMRYATRKPRLRRPPKMLHPDGSRRAYALAINKVIDKVVALTKSIIFPHLQQYIDEAKRTRGDAWTDDLGAAVLRLRQRVDEEGDSADEIAAIIAKRVSDWNLGEWQKVVKSALAVDIFPSEPWLKAQLRSWAQENAQLISTLEDDAVNQVAIWTTRGVRQGWRYEDIAQAIEDRFDVSRSRAKFIARDQVAKLNGELTKERQTEAGVKEFFWETSNDERVRGNPDGLYPKAIPSHFARNHKRYRWDDPPEGGPPGYDFGCRCTASPDLSGLLEDIQED